MHADELKLFLYGLPPDCQENTLKDFLEGVSGFPDAVTKVSIPFGKTFAFVTLSHIDVANRLLRNTLLYCDADGQFYQVKACHYVKQPFRRKPFKDRLPETQPKLPSAERADPRPVKYAPPEHVHQLTPDYSMLLLSKPKRKRKRRDDSTVWFGGAGTTSSKKRPRRKKKKKQASKLEVHKSESFQFGNLCPEDKCSNANVVDTTGVVVPVIPVHVIGQESGEQEHNVPAVEVAPVIPVHVIGQESVKQEHNTPTVEVAPVIPVHVIGQESGKQEDNITAVENVPVIPVHVIGQESGKQEDNVPAVEVAPVIPVHVIGQESGKQEDNVPAVEVAPVIPVHVIGQESGKQEDNTPAVEVAPVIPVHVVDQESGKQDNIPAVEVVHEEDQNTTKPFSTKSSQTQVIIDHSYLGPLCVQFTNSSSVADVKREIMERTALPIENQSLYCDGKKLCDSLSLRPLLEDNQDSVTLTLSTGSLKGGVRPKEAPEEGAVGGERDPSTSQEEAMQSMETWDPEKTASWLCKIGLEKYATVCQKEDITGQALLLLARDVDELMSVFQLKKFPKIILLKHLQPHLETFAIDKPQTARTSTKMMSEWTTKEICSWLRELGIPEGCLTEAEKEEFNGQAFMLLRESSELKTYLQLQEGSWIILRHEAELLLHEEKKNNSESESKEPLAPGDPITESTSETLPKPELSKNEKSESKEPLAPGNPITKGKSETPPKPVLSKEEEKLLLLKNAIKIVIGAPKASQDRNNCLVRSIFVKRGKGANALEKLLNFIVVTKHEELTAHNARKLWAKIMEKTAVWMKLLPEIDSEAFQWDKKSEGFMYKPTCEKVSLQDGKVGQLFLERLSGDEFRKSCFVVLIDKQLLKEKKTYSFSFDKNHEQFYGIKLNVKESQYHASFDVNNPSLDLKWSKYFKPIMNTATDSIMDVSASFQSDEKPLTRDTPRYQTPRPFNDEFVGKCYSEGFVLNCWETGPKDMIKPVHEFKLFRIGDNSGDDDGIKKFIHETLRFACGCLNERTNGTIHFGVADEVDTQTCGYKPRQVVGSAVTNKPLYNEKLTEFIDKCFVGPSRSNVHNCIRPPVFIPVKGSFVEQHSSDKVVIEIDIEPRYSLCVDEIFKAGFKDLGRGKKDREASAYVRHGSQTKAIVDLPELEDYLENRRPKLDEERKMRERALKKHIIQNGESVQHLFTKLRKLLCANKKVLDSSVYPILILSKPDASMTQEDLDKTFRFIQKIKWLTIFDFDDQGSESKGLCKVFKCGPDTPQCDIHEAEDYDEDDDAVENIYYKTHWIFGNGYAKLGKEAAAFKQWNKKRKRGLSQVIQSLAKKIPKARAVVLFLLLSKEYQPMADTFKDFYTYLDGPNQLVYVAENSEIVTGWEETLSNTCLEEHELRERGVVGMSWTEFQECVQQMVCGTDRDQRYVTMATGSPYPLGNVSFNGIEIVSAKECEELTNLSSAERSELSSKVEIDFYRGYPVTWMNFWFTDAQKNHVLRRDNYCELRNLIEKLYFRGAEGKVQTITVYHHIGAGASTMTRQALWDFRYNPQFPYRCAVVTKIDDSTCKELLHLRKIGYGEESEAPFPPVLALVEDTDDFLFHELRSQVVEHAIKLPKTDLPVCVFLFCKPTQTPLDCDRNEKASSVYLEQHLSQKEVDWFKDKYTEMKQKSDNKGSEQDFENYANDNLISFMIMKENYNPKYASSIVGRNLDLVTYDELTLLEFTSLLNIYNPYPLFASCFDTLMLSSSLLRKRIFRDWVEDLTQSARIFLREVDCSTHFGTGKAIAIVHPIIAGELLDQIAVRKETTVGQITLNFLKSPLLQSQGKSFTSTYLLGGANRMLKHRKKYDYGDNVQTKFSPLIEKILYVKDAHDRQKKPTEQSIQEAADVLMEGLNKFKDSMLAQQMARVYYVNAAAFSESRIDKCFGKAYECCKMAIEMNPNNYFYFDTMGRIRESEIKVKYGPIREDNRVIDINAVTRLLSLAFEAMKWFQKSTEARASVDYENKSSFHGELSVIFYLLDVLRCAALFRGQEGLTRLQGYLAYCQTIPPEVETPWSEFHEAIKGLKNRFSQCMEGITEEFTIYKENNLEANRLAKQIARFKALYHSYFDEGDVNWKTESPEERWEYRWQKINHYLAGDIFYGVFRIHRIETRQETPEKTLQLLRKLAHENYCESIRSDCYKDLLLFITTSMALHSPYRNSSKYNSAQLVEEYRDIYKFVEKLFALEECDKGYKRLHAHLLKVMFLWPRKDLELSDYRVQDFYNASIKLRTRWGNKCKGHNDTDKMLKQKVYKYMSFKKETRQFTTLFYLGKGTGLDVFVHLNELVQSRGSLDWEDPRTKKRLKRLTGVVESKNFIRVKNPLDPSQMIDIYYSSFREEGYSKEEASFYLGFSWAGPIALDVKYTNANDDHVKHSVEISYPVLDDQIPLSPRKCDFVTYEEYTSRMGKLRKKFSDIKSLKEKRNRGEELDENQLRKISKEPEYRRQLQELKQSLDALGVLEEEIFD